MEEIEVMRQKRFESQTPAAILHCLLKWGMPKSFDVCIRGDGVVGRTTALLLAKERLKVALIAPVWRERPADIRAYALNSVSKNLLESLRVWPDEFLATPVQKMQVWGDDGGAIEFNAQTAGHDALTWIVDVPRLEEQLVQACNYQSLIETFATSELIGPAPALTIICEGQQSSSRSAVRTEWTRKPYAQKAIAARLTSDIPHDGIARQWFSNGEVLALLPLGGALGNSLALVWSVCDERAASLEQLPANEFCAALSAACDASVGQLVLTGERASWPLALSSAEHWVGPGWALAGDAAHAVHPLAGQGLNLGLADAACLSQVLASREYWRGLGDEKLLRRYERARKADVASVSAVTDGLHSLFSQNGPAWQAARNWGMNGVAGSQLLKNWLAKHAAGKRAAGA
jgi:2-polyprenyl-6-methoxyphenol hydroxylase-like FAD-dependent oxidoreductase